MSFPALQPTAAPEAEAHKGSGSCEEPTEEAAQSDASPAVLEELQDVWEDVEPECSLFGLLSREHSITSGPGGCQ